MISNQCRNSYKEYKGDSRHGALETTREKRVLRVSQLYERSGYSEYPSLNCMVDKAESAYLTRISLETSCAVI